MIRPNPLTPLLVVVVLLALVVAGPLSAEALVQQAQSAEVFADSVCVNTHFGYAGSAWVTNGTRLIELIAEAGIRNIRESFDEVGLALAAKGIKMNYGIAELDWNTDSNINTTLQIVAGIKEAINNGFLIDAILGVNEPDIMWAPKNITYNGQGFPQGPMDYMRDLYTLVRADPFFDDRWIVGTPVSAFDVLPANCCSQWVDFGDMHPYPFDGNYLAETWETYDTIYRYFYFSNQPTVNVDQYPQQWTRCKAFYPDRPFFVTETGYTTKSVDGTSIRAHGLYVNRIFTEYFRLGIRRTCIYSLLNDHDDPADHESNFGLLYADYSPKPGFTALKNLMALVRSDWAPSAAQLRPPTYALATLDFGLNVSAVGDYDRTDYVHHLLLQKPDGLLLLLLWHEISAEDVSDRRQVFPPLMPTVLTLPTGYEVRVFAPNDGPGPSGNYTADWRSSFAAGETRIELLVPDHVIVLQLKKEAAAPSLSASAKASSWATFMF